MGKFKVGDRVRFTDKCRSIWWFGPHTEHKEGVISIVNEKSYRYGVTVDCESFPAYVDDEHIVLATTADATPLTITSGRYYRTRDGRKVGPMERASNGVNWTPNDGRHWYNDDGTRTFGDDDGTVIVAEWVDEPVVEDATAKFKVGDRVKFVDDYATSSRGKEAIVIDAPPSTWGFKVRQIESGNVSTERAHSLRLVAPATTAQCIVALIENGQPKPAARPFVHADREAATKEARRLAGKHKGQEFGVYELVDTAKEAKVYEHEWQRLAADGETYHARRELQRTGITGIQASRIVQEFVAAA